MVEYIPITVTKQYEQEVIEDFEDYTSDKSTLKFNKADRMEKG
jgi:hypothetical protein